MYTTKEHAKTELAAAIKVGKEAKGFNPALKHLVFLGGPGSLRMSVINMLLGLKGYNFEKAKTVTTRLPRQDEDPTDSRYIFEKDADGFMTGESQVISGTFYDLNGAFYGVSLTELTRIIQQGKHFIVIASVEGYQTLKDILGDEVECVDCEVDNTHRLEKLCIKFKKEKDAKDQINARLAFGDQEQVSFMNLPGAYKKGAIMLKYAELRDTTRAVERVLANFRYLKSA